LILGSYFITVEMLSTYTFSQFLTPFFYFFVRNPGLRVDTVAQRICLYQMRLIEF